MTSSLGGIGASVDLRGLWANVRDQGGRQSCLACATSDVHGHAQGLDHELSVEYLFYQGAQRMPGKDFTKGLTFNAADDALRNDGQPAESIWPYQAKNPSPWTPPTITKLWYGGLANMSSDVKVIFDALRNGIPVVIGVRLVHGFTQVQKAPHIVNGAGPSSGGHAVLAVGIGRRPTSGEDDLLMIRNSWGSAWGSGGYAWLPVEYLADKLVGSRTIVALRRT